MSSPHVLILHNESTYYAGAERVLEYFLADASSRFVPVVAAPAGSRMLDQSAQHVRTFALPDSGRRFSPRRLLANAQALRAFRREFPYGLIHGWAARDWELASLAARLAGVPAIGTLHDHPQARFISVARQRIMRWGSRYGLARTACVSDAVRAACEAVGYPAGKLRVAHNGLPEAMFPPDPSFPPRNEPLALGYLGAFSERKGLRGLLEMVDALDRETETPWRLHIAGGAQNEAGEALLRDVRAAYQSRPWWPRVEWVGWLDQPMSFLSSLDLLICPSSDFDPFPTVLLEAGAAGTPVLASDVGGVSEIVEAEQTGWLFRVGDWGGAAKQLAAAIQDPARLARCGEQARRRIETEFTVRRMVETYAALYAEVLT